MTTSPPPPAAGSPEGNGSGDSEAARRSLLLDSVQQRLFVVALGLNDVRNCVTDGTVVEELDRLELLIDEMIRDVRAGSSR